ncbi:MAG: hypothetical protein HKN33_13145 [Pyrinomonadaceae bacterium]|nr:hypothetical protein [Pyrinomonadaceae bacterium]
MKRKRSITNRSSRVRRQRDPIPWKYCVLSLICGLLLVAGFFAAAQQHFSSLGVAMDNAKLRVKIKQLRDQKRKLLISKERAASPAKIATLARKIGFTDTPRTVVTGAPEVIEAASTRDAKPMPVYAAANQNDKSSNRKEVHVKDKKRNPGGKNVKAGKKPTPNGSQVAALSGSDLINNVRE